MKKLRVGINALPTDNTLLWESEMSYKNNSIVGLKGPGVIVPGLSHVYGNETYEIFLCESLIRKTLNRECMDEWDDSYKWFFREKILEDSNPGIKETPLSSEEIKESKKTPRKRFEKEYRNFDIVLGLVRDVEIS